MDQPDFKKLKEDATLFGRELFNTVALKRNEKFHEFGSGQIADGFSIESAVECLSLVFSVTICGGMEITERLGAVYKATHDKLGATIEALMLDNGLEVLKVDRGRQHPVSNR